MKVSVLGSGVVGKATGIGFESKGNEVTFVDNDPHVNALLKEGGHVVQTIQKAVATSDIIMIAVPTPTVDGRFSLKHVSTVSMQVGAALKNSEYKLVAIRSTVLPSSTRTQIIPILERFSGKRAGSGFGVCVNPEFLREATALDDFVHPDRIVIGQLDQHSGRMLHALYESFERPILRCSLEEAELAKYVANGFLATKISYFNEAYRIAKKLGADPQIVSHAVSLDRRIGSYGTEGGRPFDGKCLPKDTAAFLTLAKEVGEALRVLGAAEKANKEVLPEQCLISSG